MLLPTEKTATLEQDHDLTTTTVSTVATEPVALGTVLEAIRRDCLLEPDRYLDEVRVPFGGE